MLSQSQPVPADPLADYLMAQIDSLEARAYPEIGVPTFLVAEDLTLDESARTAARNTANELGTSFAQLAGALASRKPELDTDDIAKLIEVLADRHFPPYGPDAAENVTTAADFPTISAGLPLPAAAPSVLADLMDGMSCSRAIMAVNFHATPRYREAEYRRQIAAYARVFEPITPANFASAVDGSWEHDRPGLMPMLFEGFRDNLDVLLPILEEHGFTAWLFVPSAFLSVPADQQRSYAATHELYLPERDEYPGERVALTWNEAREISRRGHVFACHSRTHNELRADTPRSVFEDEIVGGKTEMETELGCEVDIFCWLEGAAVGVNPEADALLRESGFRYLFSGFKIQKLQ